MAKKEKKNAPDISGILENIEKRFGKESISGNNIPCERVSSGSIDLDIALGGGYPKGRIVEYIGWESSGKSSMAIHLASEIQKLGKIVAYIDMEHAMDLDYVRNLGVDTDNGLWYMSQPDCGEDGIEIGREFAKSKDVGLVVIDSVNALVPRAVIQGEAGDAKMALLARMMSQMIPTLVNVISKTGCIVVFINQWRHKIGVMFGSPLTTTGGNALKFYASQRLDISRIGQEKDGDEAVANKTRVKVIKNKVSVPFKTAEFQIRYGIGIDKVQEIIDFAVGFGVIKKAGSWFSYGDVKLGQGSENVRNLMLDNPELTEEIEGKVNEALKTANK